MPICLRKRSRILNRVSVVVLLCETRDKISPNDQVATPDATALRTDRAIRTTALGRCRRKNNSSLRTTDQTSSNNLATHRR